MNQHPVNNPLHNVYLVYAELRLLELHLTSLNSHCITCEIKHMATAMALISEAIGMLQDSPAARQMMEQCSFGLEELRDRVSNLKTILRDVVSRMESDIPSYALLKATRDIRKSIETVAHSYFLA